MEMIKWGYVPKDSKTFECKNCGSIFKADSDEYKELQTPNSREDKRRIL